MADISMVDLQSEITHLSNRIDSIAEQNQAANKSWFKNISTFISVAAFLFSFGTTIVSYKRANDQDIHNLRTELRGILQRLAALPRENVEIYQKYQQIDPNIVVSLSGYIGQENSLLSKQADEVLKRLPQDQVSATDYLAVALALETSRDFISAADDFKRGLAVANTLDDEVGMLRILASLEMMTGKTGDARAHFQQALDLFGNKYREYDDFTKNYTNFLTELNWASSEGGNRDMEAANRHLNAAEGFVRQFPPGPQTELSKAQLTQTKNQIAAPAAASPANPLLAPNPAQIPSLADVGLQRTTPIKPTKR